MSIERRLEPWTPYALAALRIVAGYLFLMHGTAKLFGFPHVAMFDRLPVFSMLGVAGMLEVAGGGAWSIDAARSAVPIEPALRIARRGRA